MDGVKGRERERERVVVGWQSWGVAYHNLTSSFGIYTYIGEWMGVVWRVNVVVERERERLSQGGGHTRWRSGPPAEKGVHKFRGGARERE